MTFKVETEQKNKLFLDVNVTREQGKFLTSVYRKLFVVYAPIFIAFNLLPTNWYNLQINK